MVQKSCTTVDVGSFIPLFTRVFYISQVVIYVISKIPDLFIPFRSTEFFGDLKALHSGSGGVQLRWNWWLRFDAEAI